MTLYLQLSGTRAAHCHASGFRPSPRNKNAPTAGRCGERHWNPLYHLQPTSRALNRRCTTQDALPVKRPNEPSGPRTCASPSWQVGSMQGRKYFFLFSTRSPALLVIWAICVTSPRKSPHGPRVTCLCSVVALAGKIGLQKFSDALTRRAMSQGVPQSRLG